MAIINPTIRFNDGKCREGMNFYKELFGGEMFIMTVGESPMKGEMPEDKQDYIMHAALTFKNGRMLIGSDMMRDRAIIGDHVGISLECESEEEMRKSFDHLSQGGEVFMPIEDAFWGALFGVVTDKYGVEWMLNYAKKK